MALFGQRTSESQLMRVFEQKSTAGLFTVACGQGQNIFVSANRQFCAQFDLPATGIAGHPVGEFLSGATGLDFQRCLNEALSKRRRMVRRVCLERGERTDWFLLHLDPEPATAGSDEPDLIYGVSLEVTLPTRAEAAMTSAFGFDRLLAHSVDYVNDPVLICDVRSEGVPAIHCNPAFTRVFGYSRSELVGRDPIYLFFEQQSEAVTDLIEQSWQESRAVWNLFPVTSKSGVLIESQVVFDFYKGDEARMTHLKMTFLDPAGGSHPLDQERHRRLQIEEVLTAAGSIVNDFNNLLALILGSGKLLPDSLTRVIEAVSSSRQSATQAADILFDLLRGERPTEHRAWAGAGHPGLGTITPAHEAMLAPTQPVFSPVEERPRPVPPSLGPEPPARLLVVDDEPFIRALLRDVLCGDGYEVDVLSCGEEVLERVAQQPGGYQAIVLDYTLGSINGMEIASALRKLGDSTPILLISGYLSQDIIAGAQAVSRLTLLAKPFQPRELINRLGQLLAQTRSR